MYYDIIGDIHGCYQELMECIQKLGYSMKTGVPVHPEGRKLCFVGDAMDRGPESLRTLELLFAMRDKDMLFYSPGNHCNKFYRFAKGNKVQQAHGLETTVAELNALSANDREQFLERYRQFYEALPLVQELDKGRLLIAHAGISEQLIGQYHSEKTKTFVLYGDISGKKLPDGRPVRKDWAKHYQGKAFIVYGHTPVPEARFVNQTVNIDTGCVFGGKLSALRYPEMEIVSVESTQPYVPEKFTNFL